MTGKIISVNISREKGTLKEPVERITIDGRGVVEDAHAGDWHRQVSLLSEESITRFGEQMERECGPGEFAENITTRGLDLLQAAPLDRFRIGTVELEVTQIGKECHGDGCAIFQAVGKCVMPKEGIFCRVLQEGAVTPGDTIEYLPRPLRIEVLTLSDRASSGAYSDRSGPRLQEQLEQHFTGTLWHLAVNRTVLPDDATKLREHLASARQEGVDFLFTCGGTGIGPRDITPDVVTEAADRLIPGIMDSIRLKYGGKNLHALISRSVAALLGDTIVFTLPGSVKAVDEYMRELLPLLEHLLLMRHRIDAH